jgi:hypothetical protein
MKYLTTAILSLLLACHQPMGKSNPANKVGSEKDAHGCISAAGYIWSVLKNDCVRVFELGIRLYPKSPVNDNNTVAFVIFSADETKAELFLPQQPASVILERQGNKKPFVWEGNNYSLSQPLNYILKHNSSIIFQN